MIDVDRSGNKRAIAHASDAATTGAHPRRPMGVDDALGVLDRLARFCEFSCAPDPDFCVQQQCEAWQIERAAADWLERRWLDGQD